MKLKMTESRNIYGVCKLNTNLGLENIMRYMECMNVSIYFVVIHVTESNWNGNLINYLNYSEDKLHNAKFHFVFRINIKEALSYQR